MDVPCCIIAAVTRSSSDEIDVLTPTRRRGVEILDDPNVDAAVRHQAQADVARSNRLLGGLHAALSEMRRVITGATGDWTLVDVGTGLADIPQRATTLSAETGARLTTIGVDDAESLLAAARGSVTHGVCASAFALPFRDHSVDIAMCSQLLHHFDWPDAERLLAELDRVARRAVIVSDLRRSWVAAAGFWLVAFVLRFHPVTRHDGVVSVLRGFTTDDLRRAIEKATGETPVIRRRLAFRLTARWTPAFHGVTTSGA
jgi:ubiquinone/menaquinone biosynthesis C-methylase UbiE